MSQLFEKIQSDARDALKRGDHHARQTLGMVAAQIKNARIEKGAELSHGDVMAVLQKAIKTRRESVEQFRGGGREDLAAKEQAEIDLLESYLPRALDEAELAGAIREIITEIGAAGRKDLGRVMKEIQARHPGRVDNRTASRIASELLA